MNHYEPMFTEIPRERSTCWERLATFAQFWHGVDCPPVDYTRTMLQAEARLHVMLPDALLEWHTRFARFINQWSDRSFTIPMNRLFIENHRLIVRSERVFNGLLEAKWGIPLAEIDNDDPPVEAILGERVYPCAERLSAFAIYCAIFDTINASHVVNIKANNSIDFPAGGVKAEFPESFGIVKTIYYEGVNWIAMVSGTDWYLRRRIDDGTDEFVKHELRTTGLQT